LCRRTCTSRDGNDDGHSGPAIAVDEETLIYGTLEELGRFDQRVSAGVDALHAHHDAARRVQERQLEPPPQEPGLLGSDDGGAGPGQVS
jgi:hypothetical protein